jgi:predicted metal-dependent peptidase
LEAFDTKIHVLYVDTKVQNYEYFESCDLPLKLSPVGGGGTDFKPGFFWLEEKGIDVKAIVYFTDLCSSSFPEEPNYPVLWYRIGQFGSKPPFGQIIDILV